MKNDKKHIDRLFQEGLKNFEATPSHSVWENVSEQLLNNQEQRKVIPLWMKLSAIAASLVLLFTFGNNLFFQDSTIIPESNETIVDTESKDSQNKNNSDTLDSITIDNTNDGNNTENLAQEDAGSNGIDTNEDSSNNVINTTSKSTIVNNKDKEAIVAKNDRNTSSKNNKINLSSKKELINELAKDETASTVASNSKSNKTKVDNSQKSPLKEKLSETNDINATVAEVEKITDEIGDKDLTSSEEKSIEEAIAENNQAKEPEDELTDEEEAKRWSVAPNIAPVYFNSLGTGSSMDAEFVNNTKSGEVNMSYGVSASYAINDKINVRVGINNVKLGYNTHDVFDANDMEMNPIKSVAIKNIAIDKTPTELAYVTVAGMSFAQVPEPLTNDFNASINQELGFLEIPLEIQYKITDTKLGVNAIGGFSALFLNANDIYSTLDGNSTLIGKATNINNLSYSANLGLGFNYKVSNNININLEPMFKYQLNTFKNTSGDFKPYFIGVYSGLSFKF